MFLNDSPRRPLVLPLILQIAAFNKIGPYEKLVWQ